MAATRSRHGKNAARDVHYLFMTRQIPTLFCDFGSGVETPDVIEHVIGHDEYGTTEHDPTTRSPETEAALRRRRLALGERGRRLGMLPAACSCAIAADDHQNNEIPCRAPHRSFHSIPPQMPRSTCNTNKIGVPFLILLPPATHSFHSLPHSPPTNPTRTYLLTMGLRLGDTAPNFEAETSKGKINFHDYIKDSWALLFSHPDGRLHPSTPS